MKIAFTKMHGLGNDFIVLEDPAAELRPDADLIRRLADRRRGIGCDQLLLLRPTDAPEADIRCRVFNADGGEAEQCGNGMRCVARYLDDKRGGAGRGKAGGGGAGRGKTKPTRIQIGIDGDGSGGGLTIIEAVSLPDGQARVNMGVPVFGVAAVAAAASSPPPNERPAPVAIDLPDGTLHAMLLSLGNPHAVFTVDDVAAADVGGIGAALQEHALFPAGVNVGFMQILARGRIKLRVYERGVGETPACGSGAAAAAAAGMAAGALANEVEARLPGGVLRVSWPGNDKPGGDAPLWMSGPATRVYEGQVEI